MRARIQTVVAALLMAGTCCALPPVARADTPACSFTGHTSQSAVARRSVGWEFTASNAVEITALGFYDYGGEGLQYPHEVGVFRVSDEQLLFAATVPSGMSETLIGGFRYATLAAPVRLEPGTYRISGYCPIDTPL